MTDSQLLKHSWTTVKFGDVVRQVKNKVDVETSGLDRYIAGEHMNTDDLRIRSWGTIDDGYLGPAFTMRFKPGQVLYGSRRTYLRKVAVADFEGICANTTFVLEPKDSTVLLPELLPFIMQTESFHDHSIKQSKGSVNPYVNFSDLAWYEFALPPMEEQRRIADLLWTLEELNNTYEEAQRLVNQLVSARVEHFILNFNQDIDFCLVGDLLMEDVRNGFSPQTNDTGQGFRTVSISAIAGNKFTPDNNIKYAVVDKDRISQFLVQDDDVFVVRGNGNRYLTGKCGIATTSYDDLFYPDLLIRLRFDKARILPRFAVMQWNTPSVHRNLIARAKSTNGIWKVNGADIRSHSLVVPSLHVQTQLLNEIREIEASLASLRSRYENANTMRDHVLHFCLQGCL